MDKILWICKESFTSIANFTIPHFSNYENEAIFIHPTESLLEDTTFLNFRNNNELLKIHTLDELSKEYASKYLDNSIEFDCEKLKAFENKYCKKLDWGKLLMSSQIFTTPYHYRFYFKDLNDIQKNYWVLLLFEYFENFFSKSKPDYILDFDNSEIGRSILWLVAGYHDIPYITIEHTRYKGVVIPNFNLGREVDTYFSDYFNKDKKEYFLDEVLNFRKQENIINTDYKNNKTTKKNNNSLYSDLKRLSGYLISVLKKKRKKNKLLGNKFRFPFLATFRSSIIYFIQLIYRERYLLSGKNRYFEDPIEGEDNVYFPLHLIPESSTLIKAPNYPNEEEVIYAIAKSLPSGCILYIKEHGAMTGERPFSFYKKISRLSNVKFIKLDAYNDPKPWIQKSRGVITITGTSAFEAVMLGKAAIVLGAVPFKMIEGINYCNSLKDLAKIIKEKFDNKLLDNASSCENYLQSIYKYGEGVKFTLLHNLCYHSLLSNEKMTKEGVDEIYKIAGVLKKGINIINSKS